jgi:hypothetical protein
MKLEISRQILEKHQNIKLNESFFIGSRVFPYRRTDRQEEDDIRASQICERA